MATARTRRAAPRRRHRPVRRRLGRAGRRRAAGGIAGHRPPRAWIACSRSTRRRSWPRAEAGLLGGEYERLVTARGYTTGHYPQSIDRATLGGLVATRSAGQFSTKYGNIEDLLLGLEVVLPSGDVIRLPPVPRASTGPSLREIFLGSEGALGIVTEVTLRVFPLPERRALASFGVPSVAGGPRHHPPRASAPAGGPRCVRLYDQTETARTFSQWAPGRRLRCCWWSARGRTRWSPPRWPASPRRRATRRRSARRPSSTGSAHRNDVPSWDFFLDRELMVDTIEIAATWDRVTPLYDAVVAALQSVPGMVVASAHSSHSYVQGTNLYITFALKPEDFAHAEDVYLAGVGVR